MAGDFAFEKDVLFGEWLHEQLFEAAYFEMEPWALDRVHRVVERLQFGRAGRERLIVEIPWLDVVTAFTAPGRYIYFSRRLYERCATDEQVAFVIAHETAHHDLSHIRWLGNWTSRFIQIPGVALFALAFHALGRWRSGPEMECEADRYALDLCLAAGYDGERCLRIFDILEHHALDMGDPDIAYGPDTLDEGASWMARAQTWAWQRKRGYLSIRERRKALVEHMEKKKAAGNAAIECAPARIPRLSLLERARVICVLQAGMKKASPFS